MKKIRLELDALNVDSFTTEKQTQGQGTVRGHASAYECTIYDSCDYTYCGCGGGSGYNTCGTANTCGICHTDLDNCDTSYKHCG
jgi:hypothetical protein